MGLGMSKSAGKAESGAIIRRAAEPQAASSVWSEVGNSSMSALLASVGIHVDTEAQRFAMSHDASAVTVGRDIFFGRGQFQPGTARGRQLIAHELAHVVQQARGSASAGPASAEAGAVAVASGTGSVAALGGATFGVAQCDPAGPSELHFFGKSGESGVVVLYIRGWSSLTPQQQEQVKLWFREADQLMGAGLTGPRQRVTADMRRVANRVARTARPGLQSSQESASGHTPDVAGGGDPMAPQIDLPRRVNSSIGGQWGRYQPDFQPTGVAGYDLATGKWIYLSGALEHEPPPTTPGPPKRTAAPPSVPVKAAPMPTPTASTPAPVEAVPAGSTSVPVEAAPAESVAVPPVAQPIASGAPLTAALSTSPAAAAPPSVADPVTVAPKPSVVTSPVEGGNPPPTFTEAEIKAEVAKRRALQDQGLVSSVDPAVGGQLAQKPPQANVAPVEQTPEVQAEMAKLRALMDKGQLTTVDKEPLPSEPNRVRPARVRAGGGRPKSRGNRLTGSVESGFFASPPAQQTGPPVKPPQAPQAAVPVKPTPAPKAAPSVKAAPEAAAPAKPAPAAETAPLVKPAPEVVTSVKPAPEVVAPVKPSPVNPAPVESASSAAAEGEAISSGAGKKGTGFFGEGGGSALGWFGVGVLESWLRGKAIEREVAEKGYVPVGPQAFADLPWYDKVARFFTDMTMETYANPLDRFDVTVWRKHVRAQIAKLPTDQNEVVFMANRVWDDPPAGPHGFRDRHVEDVPITYDRGADGKWRPRVPEGGKMLDGKVVWVHPESEVPDLNRILDESVSDDVIMEMLAPGYHAAKLRERMREMYGPDSPYADLL